MLGRLTFGVVVEAIGDCFRFATLTSEENDTIVHAKVHPVGYPREYWHAWIERGDKVIDQQGTLIKFKQFDEKPMFDPYPETIKEFYKKFRPIKSTLKKYDHVRATVMALRNMHFGPW